MLLVLAVRQVNWPELVVTLQGVQLAPLGVAGLLLTLAHAVRSWRWRLLVSSGQAVALATTFWAMTAGYLGNNLLPARAGELLRAVLLSRRTGLNIGFLFATQVTERLVDAVALVLIIVITVRVYDGLAPWLVDATLPLAIMAAGGLGLVLVAPRCASLIGRVMSWLPLPTRWRTTAATLVERFLDGARALQQPRRAFGFAGLTMIIWLIDATMALQVAAAVGASLSLVQCLLLLAALGLASAAPSTPGYVGIYQFVAVSILVPLGVTPATALAYILVFQAVNYLVVGLWGGLGLWRLRRTVR